MAKKPGLALPSKPKAEPKPPPHSKSPDAGYKPTFRGGKRPSEEEEVMAGMAEDRKALYAEYNKSQADAETPPEEPAEKPETPPAAGEPEVPPVEETPAPEEEPPATPEEPPVEGEEPPKPKAEEKPKTVPHEALHEEREKHKTTKTERDALKAENLELQKRQAEMLGSLKTLTEKVDALTKAPPALKKDEPPAPITDPEAAIRQLQSEIASLRGETDTFKKQTAEQRRAVMVQDLNTRIATTGAELEKEGFQGFNYFLDQVTAEVRKQLKPDNSNAVTVDVPDNWKKIYKEQVFPKIKGMFTPAVVAAKKEEKKDLKRGAGLVGTPGAAETKAEPEKKEWGYNEWLAWQRKQRAS